jgi:hypothetical protein
MGWASMRMPEMDEDEEEQYVAGRRVRSRGGAQLGERPRHGREPGRGRHASAQLDEQIMVTC